MDEGANFDKMPLKTFNIILREPAAFPQKNFLILEAEIIMYFILFYWFFFKEIFTILR